MNFFEHKARARRKTFYLVALFVLAVMIIVIGVNVAAGLLMGILDSDPLRHLDVYLPVTLLTLLLIGGAAGVRIYQLRGGGDVVAEAMDATRVPPDTQDIQLKRLRNVVEEVALASGVAVPQVYVMEAESGINAFAAGYTPVDAVVAVTRGALDHLNRDELQAVVAHEFSHILNGDMRLNIRLMGVLAGILAISVIGRFFISGSRRSSRSRSGGKGQNTGVLFGLALMVIGSTGVFLGRLIKAGVSRQREYLADAAAVQFTRQPRGLVSALQKIGALSAGSRLKAPDTEEVSHMLFASGINTLMALLATHPPLVSRIQAVDPSFQPEQISQMHRSLQRRTSDASGPPTLPRMVVNEKDLVRSLTGDLEQPDVPRLQEAVGLIATLPPALYQAALADEAVVPLLLALLIAAGPDSPPDWPSHLQPHLSPGDVERVQHLRPIATRLNSTQRLPLVELAMPALRRQSLKKQKMLQAAVAQVRHRQRPIAVFSYVLGHMLQQHITDMAAPRHQSSEGRRRAAACRTPLTNLFRVFAFCGHEDVVAARYAFTAGIRHLFPHDPPAYEPPEDWTSVIDNALTQLNDLNLPGRRLLVEGLAATMAHDGHITAGEAELLQIVCSTLHIPAPPLLTAL